MNNQTEDVRAEARTVIEKFFEDTRLARATELAQLDKFDEAEAALMQNGVLPENARELDLLARIAARQAHFEKARRLWNKAAQLDPENQRYKEYLASLTPVRRLGRIIATHEGKLLNIVVLVIVVFVICTLIFVFRK